jgi:hypothetical protein
LSADGAAGCRHGNVEGAGQACSSGRLLSIGGLGSGVFAIGTIIAAQLCLRALSLNSWHQARTTVRAPALVVKRCRDRTSHSRMEKKRLVGGVVKGIDRRRPIHQPE